MSGKGMRNCWFFAGSLAMICAAHGSSFGRVMCLGDSLPGTCTTGYAYRLPLYEKLRAEGDTFTFVGPVDNGKFPGRTDHQNVHAGMSGFKALDLINGHASFPASGKLSDWLPAAHPDTVILMAGTNDFWDIWAWAEGYWGPGAEAALARLMPLRYHELLAEIYAANPGAKVVLMAPPKVIDPPAAEVRRAYNEHLVPIVEAAAHEWKSLGYDLRFVDMWSATSYEANAEIGPDNILWSVKGLSLCAQKVYRALHLPMSQSVAGRLLDPEFEGDWNREKLRYELRDTEGNLLASGPLRVEPDRSFQIPTPISDRQQLVITGSHWLRKVVPANAGEDGEWVDDLSLINGISTETMRSRYSTTRSSRTSSTTRRTTRRGI